MKSTATPRSQARIKSDKKRVEPFRTPTRIGGSGAPAYASESSRPSSATRSEISARVKSTSAREGEGSTVGSLPLFLGLRSLTRR
jgi:hypothetical protein